MQQELVMVKFSTFIKRRSDLTVEEFSRYWTEKHAPFIETFPEVQRYVRRYVQQVVKTGLPDRLPVLGFDGVAEMWFDTMQDFTSFTESFRTAVGVAEDEQNFLDRSETVCMLSEERLGLWAGKS